MRQLSVPCFAVLLPLVSACGNAAATSSDLDGTWDVAGNDDISSGEVTVSSGKVTAVLYQRVRAVASAPAARTAALGGLPSTCGDTRRRIEVAFTIENGRVAGSAEEVRPRSTMTAPSNGSTAESTTSCPEMKRDRAALAGKRVEGAASSSSDLKGTWELNVGDDEGGLRFVFGERDVIISSMNKSKQIASGTIADSTVSLTGDEVNVTAKRR